MKYASLRNHSAHVGGDTHNTKGRICTNLIFLITLNTKFEVVIFGPIDLVVLVWLFTWVLFKFIVKLSKLTNKDLAVKTFIMFFVIFSSTNIFLVSETKISHFLYSYDSASSFFHYLNSHFLLENSRNRLIEILKFWLLNLHQIWLFLIVNCEWLLEQLKSTKEK